MDLQKLLKIVAIVIGVISIYFLGDIISTGNDEIRAGESSGIVNMFMYVAYVILAIAVLIVLVFSVLNTASNSANLKNTLTGVAAFVVLALLCYFGFADGVETPLKDGDMLSESGSKLIGAGLYLFYLLALIAGGIMLGFGIKKMVK
jgi:Na+/H+ antiporter NhaC